MNKLLQRQIKKFLGAAKPVPKELKPLFKAISDAYDDFDVDRNLVERSFDLSPKGLTGANRRLRKNASVRDITDRKQAQDTLQGACQKLKETQNALIQAEKLKVIGDLASGVAHEIKNPLAVILQGIDYLVKKIQTDDKDLSSILKDIRNAVTKADNVIQRLLDFSSISQLDIKQENLNFVIEKALFLIKNQFEKNHIPVIKVLKKDIPDVGIDKNKIEQVFVNLFLNAIHAMDGSGRLTVKTDTQKLTKPGGGIGGRRSDIFKLGETVVIAEIDDSGSGMPEDVLNRAFDPFVTTRRGKGGTGLGLSIVKNIVDMHNGKIKIQNKKDGGVKVTLMFQIKPRLLE